MSRFPKAIASLSALLVAGVAAQTAPLTTVEYKVRGQVLEVSPSLLQVPKGIAGSVAVNLTGGAEPPEGSYVETFLRGPSFPARRILGVAGEPMLLPPLNLVGDYSLDGIRLVDGATGTTLLDGSPASVAVKVFDEVLVSRVTSRPLSSSEIEERGIVIDRSNFRAVEFEVSFAIDGGAPVPVRFPVVTPDFEERTELIPAAEIEARLAEIEEMNRQIAASVILPPELEVATPNIEVQPLNLVIRDVSENQDLELTVPPIPALMIIPGNIGYLNQFFSVQIFTENAAPSSSGLSVHSIEAELLLPPGPDQSPGTFEEPGDDPVRFARIGQAAEIQNFAVVRAAGPDGEIGTRDDVPRLLPGEVGQGEFVVEGLREGLHVLDIILRAKLDGLVAGTVDVEGSAAGSVQVSNPNFSFAFSHPNTVRTGEPYDAFVTVLNTSTVPANLVNVSLNPLNISGGLLESDETVQLGDIAPGETATGSFRIRAQRTGAITFSNITTADDSLVGRFRLRAGVDERGVPLARNSLVLPDFVDELPTALVAAAQRVLGQAISVASAPQLPPGVTRLPRGHVTAMGVQLAEAGQRVRYGEPLSRVLSDLLLDWQGARDFHEGWDQILRETDAGAEWAAALMTEIEAASAGGAAVRLADAAAGFAGRGERWEIATAPAGVTVEIAANLDQFATPGQRSTLRRALGYPGAEGAWVASPRDAAVRVEWDFVSAGTGDLSLLKVGDDGAAEELRWSAAGIPTGACAQFVLEAGNDLLEIDDDCNGLVDRMLPATILTIAEEVLEVLAVRQDPEVLLGRPDRSCIPLSTTVEAAGDPVPLRNYGNIIAVVFNKPVTQESAGLASAYMLDNGVNAGSVQVQPGGRVALLAMEAPLGALVARSLAVSQEVTDPRGGELVGDPLSVESRLIEGVVARGRVIRADGSPGAGLPVTLTYHDQLQGSGCFSHNYRPAQVTTRADGTFQFDLLLGGIPYTLASSDTTGLSESAVRVVAEASIGDRIDLDSVPDEELQAVLSELIDLADSFLADGAPRPEAIALAEGIDRAVVRDRVSEGRFGGEAVYALAFRGRGTVSGQVLASDGITPVGSAAVNLFPDPSSREQGRGVFADAEGRFAFAGVPLGTFSIEAANATGLRRVISDALTAGERSRNVEVVLSESEIVLTSLRGRVTEPDGSPHAGAEVFVGRFAGSGSESGGGTFCCIIGSALSDADGFWSVEGIPEGEHDVVAISVAGRRKAERRDIVAVSGEANTANLTLQARTVVTGVVQLPGGIPVAGALVGGGEALTTTDEFGRFTVEGVPTGSRSIPAGVERDPAAGFDFPRVGSSMIEVISGADNFVVIEFPPRGRIVGQVLDAGGQPVSNSDIAIPMGGAGFLWVETDTDGRYAFENLGLGSFTVSSPAPPHEIEDGLDAVIAAGESPVVSQMRAAVDELLVAFNNTDPETGQIPFDPDGWGFVEDIEIVADGQTVVADVRYLGKSRINGTVLNGQGVPIGALVRLTGIAPDAIGRPALQVRADINSDAALGTFDFGTLNYIGQWGLQAASPLFPVVLNEGGFTTDADPDVEGITLQFPAVSETNGGLAGQIQNEDGSPVGPDIRVEISFGDLTLRTDADGRFATTAGTFTLPGERSYTVTATDEDTGATVQGRVFVRASQTSQIRLRLLGRGSAVVRVFTADGAPAVGATVEIEGVGYPRQRLEVQAGADGVATFENVFAGDYAACASLSTANARVAGRVGLEVRAGQSVERRIDLAATATVRGSFVASDRITPIPFANIVLTLGTQALAITTTGAEGRFEMLDIPIGSFRITASENSAVRTGTALVSVALAGEVREVRIIEQIPGEVRGLVLGGTGEAAVANATVTLRLDDTFAADPVREVTTGPDGSFRFASVPPGGFRLDARDPATGARGIVSGEIPLAGGVVDLNVPLAAAALLTVQVFESDGLTPADATVSVRRDGADHAEVDTDASGRANFGAVEIESVNGFTRSYTITAISMVPGRERDLAVERLSFFERGAEELVTLVLRGTGTVSGTVVEGDGVTPVAGATVTATVSGSIVTSSGASASHPLRGLELSVVTGVDGVFSFTGLPVGDIVLEAESLTLSAAAVVMLVADGTTVTQDLVLTPSGDVAGRVLREDGSTPAGGTSVVVGFGAFGSIVRTTGEDGTFVAGPVPVGNFTLEIVDPASGGVAFPSGAIATDGEVVDLGDIVLDESSPEVVATVPAETAADATRAGDIEILFSEALDPDSVFANGIILRPLGGGNSVSGSIELLAPEGETALRLLRFNPNSTLQNATTYQLIVANGDLVNAVGAVTNRGPRDLVGRPLASLYSGTFSTRDEIPPSPIAISPSNGEANVDPRAPLRFTFNEPIQPGAAVTLTGPGGVVTGTASLILDAQVVTFVPEFELLPNARYDWSLGGVFDIAGNAMVGQPRTGFFTSLDTIGPQVAQVRIAGGAKPIVGSAVELEAVLDANESGASVRFSILGGEVVGTSTGFALRVPFTMPSEAGEIVVRAVGIDRFGNEGDPFEQAFAVRINLPPIAVDDEIEAGRTGPRVIDVATELMVNDSDPDDPEPLAFVGASQPAMGGILTDNFAANGTLVYEPPAAAIASDSFSYTVRDVNGAEATATVNITFGGNEPPVAGDPFNTSVRKLRFDGSDDLALLPVDLLDGASSWTVEFWFESPEFSCCRTRFLTAKNAAGDILLEISLAEFEGAVLLAQAGDESVFEFLNGGAQHAEISYNADSGTLRLSAGRDRDDTTNVTLPPLDLSGGTLSLGVPPGDSGDDWPFLMDELRIWRTAVDPADLGQRRNRPLNAAERALPELAGEFRFEEADGNALINTAASGLGEGLLADAPAAPERIEPGVEFPAQTVPALEDTDSVFTLVGFDPDGDELEFVITQLDLFNGQQLFLAIPDGAGGFNRGDPVDDTPFAVPGGGPLIYVPPADFNRDAELRFTVDDGEFVSLPGLLIFDGIDINDPPVGQPDNITVTQDQSFLAGNLINNDNDLEQGSGGFMTRLRVGEVTDGDHGTVEIVSPLTVRYTPEAGFTGSDSFTYRPSDGFDLGASVDVAVTVVESRTIRWIEPVSGSFTDTSRWEGGEVPGQHDVALFDQPGNYLITMSEFFGPDVSQLRFEAPSGTQTYSMTGSRQTIRHGIIGNAFATVRVDDFDSMTVEQGDVTLGRLDVRRRGFLSVSDGRLTLLSGGSNSSVRGNASATEIVVEDGASVSVSAFQSFDTAALRASGLAQNFGTISLSGRGGINGAPFENRGEINAGVSNSSPFGQWSGEVRNFGTINFTSGTPLLRGETHVVNEPGGTMVFTGGGMAGFALDGGDTPELINRGQVIKQAGVSTFGGTFNNLTFTNEAEIRLEDGRMEFSDGNRLVLTPTSQLTFVLGDTSGDTTRIAAGGEIGFGGEVALELVHPFAEPAGAEFAVATFGSRAGDFSTESGFVDNFGYTFSRSFGAADLRLRVEAAGDVPEAANAVAGGWTLWLLERGLDLQPAEDPDGDGLSALIEYAFGGDPSAAGDGHLMPRPTWVGTKNGRRPGISYRRRVGEGDLDYTVESSSGLVTWQSDEGLRVVAAVEIDGEPGWVEETVAYDSQVPEHLVLRVRVTLR